MLGYFMNLSKVMNFTLINPDGIPLEELSQLCFDNSTNAGLWGYNIGDTVYFIKTVSIIVSGRIKHYISALNT
jgi:REP element-mobilizing transposase RayT